MVRALPVVTGIAISLESIIGDFWTHNIQREFLRQSRPCYPQVSVLLEWVPSRESECLARQ